MSEELKAGQEVWIQAKVKAGPHNEIGNAAVYIRSYRGIARTVQLPVDALFDDISTTPPMSKEDAEIVRAAEVCIDGWLASGGSLPGLMWPLGKAVEAKRKAERPQTGEEVIEEFMVAGLTEHEGATYHRDRASHLMNYLKANGWELKRTEQ